MAAGAALRVAGGSLIGTAAAGRRALRYGTAGGAARQEALRNSGQQQCSQAQESLPRHSYSCHASGSVCNRCQKQPQRSVPIAALLLPGVPLTVAMDSSVLLQLAWWAPFSSRGLARRRVAPRCRAAAAAAAMLPRVRCGLKGCEYAAGWGAGCMCNQALIRHTWSAVVHCSLNWTNLVWCWPMLTHGC